MAKAGIYRKAHFKSVAAILKEFRDKHANTSEGAKAYGFLVARFSKTFSISNSEFDQQVFLEAAGWKEYVDTRYDELMITAVELRARVNASS